MSLSLKDFIYPESWNKVPNSNNDYIDACINDTIELGIYDKNNKKQLSYLYNLLSVCKYFFPYFDFDQLKMCGTIIHWIFIMDDYLEDEENIPHDKQNEILKTHEYILLTGKYNNSDPKPLERLTMLLYNRVLEWANETHRSDYYNLFITTLIQWLYAVIPLNKTKESTKPIHFDLYLFIRKYNVGSIITFTIYLLTERNLNLNISQLFLNPIFTRINDSTALQISLVNDCASYAKEIDNDSHYWNPLYFLQVRNNQSIKDTYKLIVDHANEYITQIIQDEQLLLNTLKRQGYNQDQLNQVNVILDGLHNLIQGNFNWSLITKRFYHENTPFIEITNKKDPTIVTYENILFKNKLFNKQK